MSRKLFAVALFVLSCTLLAYSEADAVDEAPAPRPVAGSDDKKPDAKPGFGGGKFGKGQIDPDKLKMLKEKFGDKVDPAKLKELKEKFGKGGFDKSKIDPEKLKELREKLKNGELDPEKLKELKEKFKKGGRE